MALKKDRLWWEEGAGRARCRPWFGEIYTSFPTLVRAQEYPRYRQAETDAGDRRRPATSPIAGAPRRRRSARTGA